MKRKPKPATAGQKIAKWYDNWTSNRTDREGDSNLARRIDLDRTRAIARAVRKDRKRCAEWVQLVEDGKIDAQAARIAIEWGEVVAEPDDPIAREADAALARAERRMST